MAGVKGRSGGPRPNSGGKRPGAGRKPKPKVPDAPMAPDGTAAAMQDRPGADAADQGLAPADDPLAFLIAVMNNPLASPALRVRSAIAAAQYKHTKRADGGKKDELVDKAKKATSGRFGSVAPPKLVVSNGR